MLIVDSQIHLWQNGKMSAHHRPIPTYSVDDALAEMVAAGVDCAVLHPPSALGEAVNVLAVEAARRHPDTFCILGHFDLQSPDRETIVARWRDRPGMLGFRFTFNQPHQKAWWTDGSLDWFWAACQKAGLPVGLLAGGNMAALKKIAERHPALKLHIDHLGRPGGGTGQTDDPVFADLRDAARSSSGASGASGRLERGGVRERRAHLAREAPQGRRAARAVEQHVLRAHLAQGLELDRDRVGRAVERARADGLVRDHALLIRPVRTQRQPVDASARG